MRPIDCLFAVVLLPVVSACSSSTSTAEKVHAMTFEKGVNGQPNRITLTQQAADRLGIRLAKVTSVNGVRAVPVAALIFDANGKAAVYTSPAALVFIRHPVEVKIMKGSSVTLLKGPKVGTNVAVVAVSELYGADTGLGY